MARRATPLENDFQSKLITRLREMVEPHGHVICMDGSYIQGFPDILILHKNRWAALECKRSSAEPYQPNQEYYLDELNSFSFASVIYPANQEEVIHDLRKALRLR